MQIIATTFQDLVISVGFGKLLRIVLQTFYSQIPYLRSQLSGEPRIRRLAWILNETEYQGHLRILTLHIGVTSAHQ